MEIDFATATLLNVPVGRRLLDIPDGVRIRPPSGDAASWQHVGENKDTASFWFGAAVALNSTGGCRLARSTPPLRLCVGLSRFGPAVGFSDLVQWNGTFSHNDWTRITGTALLTLNTPYYLSATPGRLTAVAPTAVGDVVQRIGYAATTNDLQLDFGEPVFL